MIKPKHFITSFFFAALSVTMAYGQRSNWSESSFCERKEIEKEVKRLEKEYKKNLKLIADPDLGSAARQLTNRLEKECVTFRVSSTSLLSKPRYIFEQGKGTHEDLAQAVKLARANAVQALKENAGGSFAGIITDEERFVNKNGENILEDLSGRVIKELVQGEIDRNQVVTQFYSRTRKGYTVTMVVSIDNASVVEKIKDTSKEDLDKMLGL